MKLDPPCTSERLTPTTKKWVIPLLSVLFLFGWIESGWSVEDRRYSQLKLPPEWKLKDTSIPEIPVFIYQHEEWTETLAFLEVRREDRKVNPPQSIAELKTKLEISVNHQTRYFGANDWIVHEIERLPLARGILYKVRGSYLGAARQKVYFEEWRFYLEQGFAQLTFSEEGGGAPRSSTDIESLMKRYTPFGESL